MASKMSGPIPGENYTSDTKNYPWHRPPEITDFDKAVEASAKQLMSDEGAQGIVTLLESGMDIATLTDMFVTSGIGAGKWTPDFAILLAGPVSHIIYLMAKGQDIDADLGIERAKNPYTKVFFDEVKMQENKVKQVEEMLTPEFVQEVEKKLTGFMSMGQTPEVPTEQIEQTEEV